MRGRIVGIIASKHFVRMTERRLALLARNNLSTARFSPALFGDEMDGIRPAVLVWRIEYCCRIQLDLFNQRGIHNQLPLHNYSSLGFSSTTSSPFTQMCGASYIHIPIMPMHRSRSTGNDSKHCKYVLLVRYKKHFDTPLQKRQL